jgi:hypothetical protein
MMDIQKSLVVTRMDGPNDSDPDELINPTWSEIESAIRRLDGNTCTLLVLGIGEPPVPHMAIGGGEDGKYIVYTTADNLSFATLINPAASFGKCLLVAGGQRGEYDLRKFVSLTDAMRAAKTYAETGATDPTLAWDDSAR